jgi:hypothetical protein
MAIVLAFITSVALWADCEHPTIRALKTVSHMPPTRYQENSQLCFAMSSMQLVNRLSCVQTRHCDFGFVIDPGPDEFSIREAIREYYKSEDVKTFGQGGKPQVFLQKISKLGKLAPEICAPFAQLDSLSLSLPEQDMNEFLVKTYEDYKATKQSPHCYIATHLHNLQEQGLYLKTLTADIEDALMSQKLSDFMQKVMLPPRCESQRRNVPRFSVHGFDSENEGDLRKKIEALIDSDTPMTFGHNIYTRLPSSDPDQIIGAHDANIIGKREVCCGGKCESQYEVADSSGVTPTERWESQAVVLKSIQELGDVYRFARNAQSSTPLPMKIPALLERILERASAKAGRTVRIEELHLKSGEPIGDQPELTWIESSI